MAIIMHIIMITPASRSMGYDINEPNAYFLVFEWGMG